MVRTRAQLRRMQTKDLNSIADELIHLIFDCLNPEEILRFQETCLKFYKISLGRDAVLWRPFIDRVLRNKTLNVPTGNLMDRIQKLSLPQMQKFLNDVDQSNFETLYDYQQITMIKILFLYPYNRIPTKECHWLFHLPPWKATYFHLKKDFQRKRIMISELLSIIWKFRFKGMPTDEDMRARFLEDNTMISNFMAHPYKWRVRSLEMGIYMLILICLM